MNIFILDTAQRFEDENGVLFERYNALLSARTTILDEHDLTYPDIDVDIFKGRLGEGEVQAPPVEVADIVFIHQKDLNDHPELKGLLRLNDKNGPKVVKFSGAEEGASLDQADFPKRVFAINRSIEDPIFNDKDTWEKTLYFLLNNEHASRPKWISPNLVPPIHAAALILLQGYQLASHGMDGLCKDEDKLKPDQQLEAVVTHAQAVWKGMTAEEKKEYWVPLGGDVAFLENFSALQAVINDSTAGDVDIQTIFGVADAIRKDAGFFV